jgi:hypothetical protein
MRNKVLFLTALIAGSALPAFPKSPDSMVLNVPEGGAPWMYALLAGVFCFGAIFLRSTFDRRALR